jgi:hypothetical protein
VLTNVSLFIDVNNDLQFHGTGVLEYPDGSRYEGFFNQGARSGRGTMKYSDGSLYVGEWKDDRV